MRGRFLPVFWSPVWFPSQKPNTMGLLCDPAHPLFAQFPTEFHSDWQWYELMQHSRAVHPRRHAGRVSARSLQVIDNFARNHKLGVVFEGRVGRGQLLVCGFDLPAMTKDPAARQLLASLYAYVGSAAFKPTQEFSGDLLEKLFVPKFANKLQELGATIRADSQARRLSRRQRDRRRPEHDVAHAVGRAGAEVPARTGGGVSQAGAAGGPHLPAAPGRQSQRLDQGLRRPRQRRRQELGRAGGARRVQAKTPACTPSSSPSRWKPGS